jgi:uncharacterized integral membrane protein (TIGR00698 family)
LTLRHAQIILFCCLTLLCMTGLVSPPVALALGVAMALTVGQPFPDLTHRATKVLLQASIVGLGFGMNLGQVWKAGRTGFGFTVATIAGTLLLGWLLGKALRVDPQTSLLVSSGTAICGGSAIAAVGAVLDADRKAMSVSLGTVFILNACALFIFPGVGKHMGMTQQQFGMWSAIAIHDTSSVVGAASKYGDEALRVATTVKLTRALWIIPLSLGIAVLTRKKNAKVTLPWFVLFFLLAAGVNTVFPQGEVLYGFVQQAAKIGLTLTLFLIGTGLSREAIRTVGARAMIQGVLLWIVISLAGLFAVWQILGP